MITAVRALLPALLLIAVGTLAAQPPSDSTRLVPPPPSDTLPARRDTAGRPPLPGRFAPPHGALLADGERGVIDKREIVRSRYHTLHDILLPAIPALPVSHGTPGSRRELSIAAADPGTLPVQFDGRPLAMPGESPWSLEWSPVEYLDRVEVVDGARAFLLGRGSSLRLVNLVHPRFDVEGSYARASYVQGGNGTTVGDITYARTIGGELSVTAGFRRLRSNGSLPSRNSDVSNWNGRIGATWYPSQRFSLSFTEMFTDASYGNNGGLTAGSSRIAALATVLNDSLIERMVRHDLTLSARLLLDTPPLDSAAAELRGEVMRLEGSLYYTSSDPRLEIGTTRSSVQGGRDLLPRDIVGLRGLGVLPLSSPSSSGSVPLFVTTMLDARASAAGLGVDGAAMVSLSPDRSLSLRGGVTARYDDAVFGFGLAGDVDLKFGDLSLGGALALPLSLAPDALLGVVVDTAWIEREITRLLGEGRVGWRSGDVQLEGGALVRMVERVAGSSALVISPTASLRFPLVWDLALRLRAVGLIDPDHRDVLPMVTGSADLLGVWNLFGGNLNLTAGTTLEGRTKGELWERDPESGRLFALTTSGSVARDSGSIYPLWSVWAVGRIGSAFVRVEWRNLLDIEYTTLYRHPEFRREILFSFNWAFID